jgi:hypothetical protein
MLCVCFFFQLVDLKKKHQRPISSSLKVRLAVEFTLPGIQFIRQFLEQTFQYQFHSRSRLIYERSTWREMI